MMASVVILIFGAITLVRQEQGSLRDPKSGIWQTLF